MFFLPSALDDERRVGVGGQRALFPQALDRALDELCRGSFTTKS
jgi:hypothetical protein